MNRPNNISDRDKKLAEEFRSGTQKTQTGDLLNDPFLRSLNEFKTAELAENADDLNSRKKNSWNRITESIEPSRKQQPTIFYRLGRIKHFGKIAALITVSLLLSIYYFQQRTPLSVVVTAEGTIESVTLSDGSNVTLRPHSTLYKKQTGNESRTYHLDGEAYFDVVKDERPFHVHTDNGVVEVLGTEFNLRTWDNSTDVYLVTGSLRLSSEGDSDAAVLISPGEFSSLRGNQTISQPSKIDEKQFLSWRDNEIIFTNRTAESIFNELEHHYSITIVAPENINAEILGGSISLENTGRSLENLGTVLGGTFELSGTNTYKFVSSE